MPKQLPALSRAIEGFILWKSASGLSDNTISDYRIYLTKFCNWLNDPYIDKISPKEVEAFFTYMQNDYRCTRGSVQTDKKMSSKTIGNIWIGQSGFWKWAVKEYGIKNPLNIPKARSFSQPVTPFSLEEVEKIMLGCDYASESSPSDRSSFISKRPTRIRDRAIVLTLLDTGMRVSGLCGINVEDIEFQNGRNESGRVKVVEKGNKTRYVYFGKRAKQALFAYYSERFPRGKPAPDEPFFVDKKGFDRLTRNAVQALVADIGNRVGVVNVHPHRFRHTFAIEFLRNGGNVFTLQQLLGHSSLDMVRHYVQLAQIDLVREHEKASPADNWRLKVGK